VLFKSEGKMLKWTVHTLGTNEVHGWIQSLHVGVPGMASCHPVNYGVCLVWPTNACSVEAVAENHDSTCVLDFRVLVQKSTAGKSKKKTKYLTRFSHFCSRRKKKPKTIRPISSCAFTCLPSRLLDTSIVLSLFLFIYH
jgi:hypothetical protein